MKPADQCRNVGCTRSRRWPTDPATVARYCAECTTHVLVHAIPPVLAAAHGAGEPPAPDASDPMRVSNVAAASFAAGR